MLERLRGNSPKSVSQGEATPTRSEIVKRERKQRKKKRKRIVAGSITAALLVVPVTHPENTVNVFNALTNRPVSCVDTTPSHKGFAADVIAVPGATSKLNAHEQYVPNNDEQVRLKAAVSELARGVAPEIVLLAGQPSTVDATVHLNAEVTYAKVKYKKLTGRDLPDSAISAETRSRNTFENMDELKKMMDNKGAKVAAIVTNGYHLPRSTVAACVRGVNAFGIPAESVAVQADPSITRDIVPPSFKTRLKERVETIESLEDPWSFFPRLLEPTRTQYGEKRVKRHTGTVYRKIPKRA